MKCVTVTYVQRDENTEMHCIMAICKCKQQYIKHMYEGAIKSFQTGHLQWELQMVQLSATRCSIIAILWVSLVSFATITLCVASQWVYCLFHYRLSPKTFEYNLVWSYPPQDAILHTHRLPHRYNKYQMHTSSTDRQLGGENTDELKLSQKWQNTIALPISSCFY
jgi:hypothetical protein